MFKMWFVYRCPRYYFDFNTESMVSTFVLPMIKYIKKPKITFSLNLFFQSRGLGLGLMISAENAAVLICSQ